MWMPQSFKSNPPFPHFLLNDAIETPDRIESSIFEIGQGCQRLWEAESHLNQVFILLDRPLSYKLNKFAIF